MAAFIIKFMTLCSALSSVAAFGKNASRGKRINGGRFAPSGAGTCTADYHNCFPSEKRRCCNEASRCYTKAAGVPFGQCRPRGCKGMCGWECRVLNPGVSTRAQRGGQGRIVEDDDTPVFGKGAQNLSQAIAAMTTPLPRAAPNTPRPAGSSQRLGNVIDAWYFASLNGGSVSNAALAHLMSLTCNVPTCFGRFLSTQLGAVTATPAQRAVAHEEALKHDSWGMYPGLTRRLHFPTTVHTCSLLSMYSYPTMRLLMPALRHDLRIMMRRYAHAHDPALLQQAYDGGARHLLVHYRLGDFVTNNWCIPPKALAAAAAPLAPTVIELMDGGVHHLDQVNGYSAAPHRANRTRQDYAIHLSATLQGELEEALRAALPHAKVVRAPVASIDADWFRLAQAPLLVTGAGSFAVTAAIAAAHAKAVRTPAAANLNFPDRGRREEEEMASNWRTYAYDEGAMRG